MGARGDFRDEHPTTGRLFTGYFDSVLNGAEADLRPSFCRININ